ncbi:MAG: putative metal-dependent hydrolase [Parasphingorhabdus sp.]|jgi:predicted metal-dependent hydrolase
MLLKRRTRAVVSAASVTVSGIEIQVLRKSIKNLNFVVRPPDGQVRLSVPKRMTDAEIRLAITSRLAWIIKHQETFKYQTINPPVQFVSGENHSVFGKSYTLDVLECNSKPGVILLASGRLNLSVRPKSSTETRAKVLNNWYRDELKKRMPGLLEKWQPVVGKEAQQWGVKKMKTRWGSCNILKRRIWLNLELAKKPAECLEYVLVHELVHLHERYHNKRFYSLMDKFMPSWRIYKKLLNAHS